MTVKMALLAVMGLILLIPLMLIREVIRERAGNAEAARAEIGALWAGEQTITGPVLNVPGTRELPGNGSIVATTMHVLPGELNVTGVLKPEMRYRGIYETVVYDSDIELTGRFAVKEDELPGDYTWDWDKAYISLGVTDNKGISDEPVLALGGRIISAVPGTGQQDLFEKGISFLLPADAADVNATGEEFKLILSLRGSGSLFFSPVGMTTRVSLSSDWDAPSFAGSFLPAEREVTAAGFSARWVVTQFNRSFPQVWTGGKYIPSNDSFGVNLLIEADHYTKAERTVKYGLLFIALTFLVLIIIELRSARKIHLFYYMLDALALILFFSLLTALSEHIGFNPAYLVAAAATIGLLTLFFRSLLEKGWMTLLISGLLTGLYLFIFILLSMKDYAFLAGNIGLFVLLAALMLLSARYKLFRS